MNAKTIAIVLLVATAAMPSGLPGFGIRMGILVAGIFVGLVGAVLAVARRRKANAAKPVLELHSADQQDDEFQKAA